MESNIVIQKERSLVNAVYRLTLEEQRIFHYAIAKVNPFKHKWGNLYEISILDVVKFYGLESNKDTYARLYDALDKLFERKATYYDNQRQSFVTCRLISRKYDDKKGVIGFMFSDEMNQMVSADKDFLSYKLAQTVGITSVNANRIYEVLLYQLQRCPINKYKVEFDIKEFKQLLGLSDKYGRFTDFKKYVLDVAKLQINKHTDIRISFESVKTGRTPTSIIFTAQYKKGRRPEEIKQDPSTENQKEIDYEAQKSKENNANKDTQTTLSEEQKNKNRGLLSEFKKSLGFKRKF